LRAAFVTGHVKVSEIHSASKDVTGGLAAVFEANRPALRRFLVARRARPDEADDILQELFLKIGKLPTGPIADPLAYLYRIADNLLLDLRRAQSRRNVREDAWTMARHGAGEIDDQPSAEDLLIARERLGLVQATLSRLPERTVTAFRRFRLDGIGQRQIAAELGISVSAVEKHLQRAYRTLLEARSELDAELPAARRPIDEGD
jgi:RNA polymerase sigma factor (sigma-70 family)